MSFARARARPLALVDALDSMTKTSSRLDEYAATERYVVEPPPGEGPASAQDDPRVYELLSRHARSEEEVLIALDQRVAMTVRWVSILTVTVLLLGVVGMAAHQYEVMFFRAQLMESARIIATLRAGGGIP